jgi:hypothetical protein
MTFSSSQHGTKDEEHFSAPPMIVVSRESRCNQVFQWMVAHGDSLPCEYRQPTTDSQRAESLLRKKIKHLKSRKDHPPNVCSLLDQIESLVIPYGISTCNRVLAWMDAHDGAPPMSRQKPKSDCQRAEGRLISQFRYLKRKSCHSPDLRTLIDRIGSRTLQWRKDILVGPLLRWMGSHGGVRPLERKRCCEESTLARRLRKNHRRMKDHPNDSDRTKISEIRIPRRRLNVKQPCVLPKR